MKYRNIGEGILDDRGVARNSAFKFVFRVLPFIIGMICAQKIVLGGEIYIGEILAVAYLTLNLKKLDIGRGLRQLLLLAFIWAFCQLLSDQINRVDVIDSVKGVGAPLIFMSTLLALCIYMGKDIERMPSFLIGALFGLIPQFIFYPSTYFLSNPWKWGVGLFAVEYFAVYFTFFYQRKRSLYLIFFVVIFAGIGLSNDSRSMAIFPTLAAMIYVLARTRRFGSVLTKFKGRFGVAKLVFTLGSLLLVLNSITTTVFSSDWISQSLPQESAKKFQMQAGGEYGILLGGRNEMLVSIDAFLEKPLLGHGSWAKDNGGYENALLARTYALGYSDRNDLISSSDLIPVHSYLMGGLVWAGIAGGLFWLFMMRWLLFIFISNISFLGFYFYNGIVAIMWNIFFSPFGASARWSSAIFIASLYCYVKWFPRERVGK